MLDAALSTAVACATSGAAALAAPRGSSDPAGVPGVAPQPPRLERNKRPLDGAPTPGYEFDVIELGARTAADLEDLAQLDTSPDPTEMRLWDVTCRLYAAGPRPVVGVP